MVTKFYLKPEHRAVLSPIVKEWTKRDIHRLVRLLSGGELTTGIYLGELEPVSQELRLLCRYTKDDGYEGYGLNLVIFNRQQYHKMISKIKDDYAKSNDPAEFNYTISRALLESVISRVPLNINEFGEIVDYALAYDPDDVYEFLIDLKDYLK